MKIISKFSDYYDAALERGVDESVMYMRHEEMLAELTLYLNGEPKTTLQTEQYAPLFSNLIINHKVNNKYQAFFHPIGILFVGTFYGGIKVHLQSNDKSTCGQDLYQTFYDYEAIEAFLQVRGFTLESKKKKRDFFFKSARTVKEHLQVQRDQKFMDLAIKHKSPIIIVEEVERKCTVVKNTNLDQYQFYRVVDHFTTFQEINMFISGILAPENKPMTVIEDKYKIVEHGFDQLSFRCAPQKRR